MTRLSAIAGLGLLLMVAALAAPAAAGEPTGPPVDFAAEIAPLLTDRCLACHDAGRAEGGLDLSTARSARAGGEGGPAVVPGRPDEGSLLEMIAAPEGGGRPSMPAKGDPFTPAQVARFRRWVAEGAAWPDGQALHTRARADLSWWSLLPLARPEPPNPAGLPAAWAAHPVDRFLFAGLRERGLDPSPPADRRTLIRRVTYDLTGLPPTPEEARDFGRDDAPDAYERLVDRLLASPRYGEHWGRHWLDVARFGESTGFERNLILDNAWPYRDYVIRSFNEDKPFGRFIVEQLAGDVVAAGEPSVEVATTFLVAGPYDNVGNQDAAQARLIRANTLDDVVAAAGSAFLGLTIHCARCHDHKFDPIPQEDYYRLQAAFAGVAHGERVVATPGQRRARDARLGPLLERQRLLTRDRTELETTPETDRLDGAERRRRLDEDRRDLADVAREIREVPPLPRAWAGTFAQPAAPSYLMLGGDPERRGPVVAPASPAVLRRALPGYALPPDAPEAERRLSLARWIARDDNPLTARVLANRVWQYHFGTGLVDTPSDFGYLGGRPSHPALLDWLAGRLRHHGWRLKPLHREILRSQAYRQSGRGRADAASVDASARLLWRFPPRRLSAEEVRDTALAVAGVLDGRMGGPGFRLYRYANDNVSTYTPLDEVGPETYRRAVYHQAARAAPVDLLSDFDCPDPAAAAPARAATTSPLQALTLMNHAFTRDMARALAGRVEREAGRDDPDAQVRRAFELAFGRPPADDEARAAAGLVRRHGLPALGRALLNATELISVD